VIDATDDSLKLADILSDINVFINKSFINNLFHNLFSSDRRAFQILLTNVGLKIKSSALKSCGWFTISMDHLK
jgi:hypothetical protein